MTRGTSALTGAGFHILVALGDAERHGYEIMQVVAEDTGGAVRTGPTTLYRSIRGLMEAGLIEESDRRPAPEVDDERRRYYRLTAAGRDAARAETERLRRLVAVADTRTLGGPADP
jgi:DNA-binding PadR family transcriptional regulator